MNLGESTFYALGWISPRAMRQTPSGGIMDVVANPLGEERRLAR
jgi:hypothetical protein